MLRKAKKVLEPMLEHGGSCTWYERLWLRLYLQLYKIIGQNLVGTSWLTREGITGSQTMGHQYFPQTTRLIWRTQFEKDTLLFRFKSTLANCIWVYHPGPWTFPKLIAQFNMAAFLEPITSPQDCKMRQEIPHRQARLARFPDFARESHTLLFLREI